jgi:A/G-specific adenine glycosylase
MVTGAPRTPRFAAGAIAAPLLRWFAVHGRRDLPWQRGPTPYRVWVSEVMLQQTQVQTVIGYYERFMARFPTLLSLAAAPPDEVLHLWAGLGYYSRARNLQRAAQQIVAQHAGELPRSQCELQALPGIGRSTAAAILALSGGARHAILDGNVKRVLSRYFALDGTPEAASTQAALWQLAEQCTPQADIAAYTQAIMDLGATLCTRSRPRCSECPLHDDCRARIEARQAELPARRTRRVRPQRTVHLLVARRGDGAVLLERRPPRGIWGGLWSLPEFADADAAADYCQTRLHRAGAATSAAPLHHAFTHFDLAITPVHVGCEEFVGVMDGAAQLWYNAAHPERIGLPAPVQQLINEPHC